MEGSANNINSRPNGQPQQSNEMEISIQDLFERLFSGKWLVLTGYVLVLGSIAFYTYTKAPEYESSSLLLINSESSTPQLGELMGLQVGNRNVANEIEIIKSRTIALRVADYLIQSQFIPGTEDRFTVLSTSEERPSLTQLDVANRLLSRYISVTSVGRGTDLITIKVKSTVPREAAFISNVYADEYVNYNLMQSRRRYTASREFLEEQAARADSVVADAESDILSYTTETGVVDPQVEADALLNQLLELDAELYRTDFELRAAQSELQTLEFELDRITPGLASTLNTNDNEAIAALRTRITQLQVENAELLSRNPELAQNPSASEDFSQNRQTISDLTDDLKDLTSRLVDDMFASGSVILGQNSANAMERIADLQLDLIQKRLDITGAQARKDVLESQRAVYRDQLDRNPEKAVLLARFDRNMETSAQLYTTIFESLQEARIAERSEIGYVDVIDEAVVPSGYVTPQIPLNLMVGAILGFLLGVISAFIRAALERSVLRPEDLRQKGFTVLGVIPHMREAVDSDFGGSGYVDLDGRQVSTSVITVLNPLAAVSESYRRLRTNVDFSSPDSAQKIVLLTSAEPGEGKTATSVNLAVANAQLGRRTLMLDADMRRPKAHLMLGVSRTPGLTEWLFESEYRRPETLRSPIEDLYVLPVGKAAPNPAELLGSARMKDFVAWLRNEFDTVIIDTPPVLTVSDALSLAPLADSVIQVVSTGETDWSSLERTSQAFLDIGIQPTGVVLNRFDAYKAYGGYGAGHRYGYGYGYGGYGYGSSASLYADGELEQLAQTSRRI